MGSSPHKNENLQPVETVYLRIYYMIMDKPPWEEIFEYGYKYDRLNRFYSKVEEDHTREM